MPSPPSGVTPARIASACHPSDPTVAGRPAGLVEAPSVGLDAPVAQGDAESQLADAVGHVPASSWPDQVGTTVLVAHDISWFSRINHLRPGQEVAFVGRCATRWYTVTSGRVVRAGSPVYNTTTPRLVLVTCYPLDALFLTSERYEVTAVLTKVTLVHRPRPTLSTSAGTLPTSLPASVVAEVGPRVTTTAPLGRLLHAGTPSTAWSESNRSINAAGSALELYFGALQVAERSPSLWSRVAPGVPPADAAPLDGATVTGVPGPVTPTLHVQGSTVTGATVASTVELAGGPDPGTYTITMTAAVHTGRLTVTGWLLTSR